MKSKPSHAACFVLLSATVLLGNLSACDRKVLISVGVKGGATEPGSSPGPNSTSPPMETGDGGAFPPGTSLGRPGETDPGNPLLGKMDMRLAFVPLKSGTRNALELAVEECFNRSLEASVLRVEGSGVRVETSAPVESCVGGRTLEGVGGYSYEHSFAFAFSCGGQETQKYDGTPLTSPAVVDGLCADAPSGEASFLVSIQVKSLGGERLYTRTKKLSSKDGQRKCDFTVNGSGRKVFGDCLWMDRIDGDGNLYFTAQVPTSEPYPSGAVSTLDPTPAPTVVSSLDPTPAPTAVAQVTATPSPTPAGPPLHNYSEALQKALFFYEIQSTGMHRDGGLRKHRVEWRGPAALKDGADVGRDLSGGWYDAGDGVVWTGNDAFGASMLAWSLIRYPDVFKRTGQYQLALERLAEISDYLSRVVQLDENGNISRIYVGKGASHDKYLDGFNGTSSTWPSNHSGSWPYEMAGLSVGGIPIEDRASFWVDASLGGADVAGSVSAALAAASIATREGGNATGANALLGLARKVFEWGDAHRNASTQTKRMNHDGVTVTTLAEYPVRSTNSYPQMIYAAAWLHRAEVAAATSGYTNGWILKASSLYDEPGNTSKRKHWQSFATNSQHNGAYVMLAADSGLEKFVVEANAFADFWLYSRSNTSGLATDPTITPAGFIARNKGAAWNINYLMDEAPPLLEWARSVHNASDSRKSNLLSLFTGTYSHCPVKQLDYVLGDNPRGVSYLQGYAKPGQTWVRNLHHVALRFLYGGFGTPPAEQPGWNTRTGYGVLAPGPDEKDDYPFDVPLTSGMQIGFQETIIYSGGILTVLAENIKNGGPEAGKPLGTFPEWEPRSEDYQTQSFFAESYSQSATRIQVVVNNRASLPPRGIDTLGFRYYFVPDGGVAGSAVTVNAVMMGGNAGESVSVSAPVQVGSSSTWYVDVRFLNAMFAPGEYNRGRRQVQLDFGPSTFARDNDPSGSVITSLRALNPNIPIYDYSTTPPTLLGGFEPSPGYVQWRMEHFNNVTESSGQAVLVAERVGGMRGAVSATVAVSNGSALKGSHFLDPVEQSLSWADGEKGEKTVAIPILNDGTFNERRYFSVTLTPSVARPGKPVTARVSIEEAGN